MAAALSLAWLGAVAMVGHVRPSAAGGLILAVWAALAVGFAFYTLRVRGPRVARSPASLALLMPLGVVVVLVSTWVGGALLGHTTDHHAGELECWALSLVCSLGPLALGLFVERRSDPVAPGASGAALGAIAGALGGAAMSFVCARTEMTHVLWGHLTGFVAVVGVATLVGRRVLALR